ncbi:hypothetical protein VSH64_39645 [Amycolatopsis rhabdoformis]|uniref:Uncharacterized protein n=1 Tax=Amycolatopsis rhabdoformis TaxID=1448059 RepID=A0ABZ1I4K5_9PSEU|nr:hypothetical protein [Amycolatopsis rhabdoformis]WSE28881.1 hypothetical protein VSH64_39645 [Amycolatopsis rhabdoformis]
MRRTLLALGAVIGLLFATALPADAYEPVNIVHTEHVQAGPYGLTVGFSTWPLRAMQSLDFTFIPDGGIGTKTGTLAMHNPASSAFQRPQPLARHPRKRDVWGLDIRALPTEGAWAFRFTINGPQGQGTGELANLRVLAQPGPPMGLSWAISSLPLIGLVVLVVIAWRRTRGRLRGGGVATAA